MVASSQPENKTSPLLKHFMAVQGSLQQTLLIQEPSTILKKIQDSFVIAHQTVTISADQAMHAAAKLQNIALTVTGGMAKCSQRSVRESLLAHELSPIVKTAHDSAADMARLVVKSADEATHVATRLQAMAETVTDNVNSVQHSIQQTLLAHKNAIDTAKLAAVLADESAQVATRIQTIAVTATGMVDHADRALQQTLLAKRLGPVLKTAHENAIETAQLVAMSVDRTVHVATRLHMIAMTVAGLANCSVGGVLVGSAIFDKDVPPMHRVVHGATGLSLYGAGVLWFPVSVPVATLSFSAGVGYKAASNSAAFRARL